MAPSSVVGSTVSVGVPNNQKEFTETMRSDINQSDSRLPQIDHMQTITIMQLTYFIVELFYFFVAFFFWKKVVKLYILLTMKKSHKTLDHNYHK